MNKPNQTSALPSGWMLVSVSEVGAVRLGRQRSGLKLTGRYATKYLRAANITTDGLNLTDVLQMDFTPEEREVYALKFGDVLLAEASGSPTHVGRSAIWRNQIPNCCFQNTVIRFRPHSVLPEYSQLVFQHYVHSGLLAKTARGVGLQHLGATRFANLPFPLPPMEEQKRIVDNAECRIAELHQARVSLDSALDRIEEQQIEIIATAVYGRLAPDRYSPPDTLDRPPHNSPPTSSISPTPPSETPNLFDEPHTLSQANEASPTSPLPNRWSWSPIPKVGSVKVGLQRSSSRLAGRYPTKYLRTANIVDNQFDLSDVLEMDFAPSEQEKYSLKPGDILIVEASGSAHQVARSAIWRGQIESCCFQNHLIRFRPTNILSEYAHLVLTHYRNSGVFAQLAKGLGILHLGLARFSTLQVPVPPMAEQKRIAKEALLLLENNRIQYRSVKTSLHRLSKMTEQILAAAVTGELEPQQSNVEPAEKLLTRLGPPTLDRKTTRSRARSNRRSTASPPPSHGDHTEQSPRNLEKVLHEAGRTLSVPELLSMAGYDRDSPAEIEKFYIAIRQQLGSTLRQFDEASENAILGLASDAH